MTILEAIAVVFSIACVVLAARRHVGTWPAGIVAVIAYFVVFVRAKLYADAMLQVVFLGQGVYGWYRWKQGGISTGNGHISALSHRQRVMLAIALSGSALAIGSGLARYTDASRPWLDATVSVLSLAANWLLARRIIDNWALWLTADVLYIGLFASKELFASAALYVVFLALAVTGWRSWLRSMSVSAATASPIP